MASVRSFAVLQVIFLVALGMLAGTCTGRNLIAVPGEVTGIDDPAGSFAVKNSLSVEIRACVITKVSLPTGEELVDDNNCEVVPSGQKVVFPAKVIAALATATSVFRIDVNNQDRYQDNPSLTSAVGSDTGKLTGTVLIDVVGNCKSNNSTTHPPLQLDVSVKTLRGVPDPLLSKTVCYPYIGPVPKS